MLSSVSSVVPNTVRRCPSLSKAIPSFQRQAQNISKTSARYIDRLGGMRDTRRTQLFTQTQAKQFMTSTGDTLKPSPSRNQIQASKTQIGQGLTHTNNHSFLLEQLNHVKPRTPLFAQLLASAKQHFKNNPYKNIWVGVDRAALVHNVKSIRSHEPDKRFCAVLKADAYGHGVDIVAPVLEPYVDVFGITENHEANTIQATTQLNKPIMRVRLADPFEIGEAMESGLTIEELVGSFSQAKRISDLSQALERPRHPIHLALDCPGMGRDGFNTGKDSWPEVIEQVQAIKALPGVQIVGIFGHLPVSDNPEFDASRTSAERFISNALNIKELIDTPLEIHLLASAGTQRAKEIPAELRQHITLNRAGGAIFGHKSFETEKDTDLKHVMNVCTFVTGVFSRPSGASIGYGSHYRVSSDINSETHAHVPGGWAILPREALLAQKDQGGLSRLVVTNEFGGSHRIMGNPSMNSVICKAQAEDSSHVLSEMEPVYIISSKHALEGHALNETILGADAGKQPAGNPQSDEGAAQQTQPHQDSNRIADILGSTGARVTVHIGTAKNIARIGFN